MTRVHERGRRLRLGSPAATAARSAFVVVLVVLGLVSCSSSGSSTVPAAPPGQRPSFRATWLPVYFDAADVHVAPQYVRWTGPGGRSSSAVAEAFIFTGSNERAQARLSINAVTTAMFPSGYWKGFSTSDSYQQLSLGELRTAIREQGSKTFAISTADGYILQTSAANVPVDDVKRFLAGVQWQKPR